MKKILIALMALTIMAQAVQKDNIAEAFGLTVLAVLAFPGILVAEVAAFSHQQDDECDAEHFVYVYIPLPKHGEFKFKFTCEEWVE